MAFPNASLPSEGLQEAITGWSTSIVALGVMASSSLRSSLMTISVRALARVRSSVVMMMLWAGR
ncbi:hypothetical protein [Nonomuraea basaltis]|uniref:hypothetical protein n=1 Tax=Nonomuraea basaltis TaxID=2495887 RepID=UPI00110C6C91|nr:hypothetical protein [Nonomuraea basaltis]TMR94844.1 hypothetical protein EJK15_31500 [Nonomuraea basaltis]